MRKTGRDKTQQARVLDEEEAERRVKQARKEQEENPESEQDEAPETEEEKHG